MKKLNDKKILALIPARAGSKSVPKKNIIDINGHPLLAYSIAAAKLSTLINRIIVSTDSEEFAKIARFYGAETPFLRPKKYARDASADRPYYEHALNWLEKHEGYIPDYVVNLRPVTPARNPKIIDKGIREIIQDKKATGLRSAQATLHPGYKMFRKKGDYMHFLGSEDFKKNEEYYDYCRQTLPPTYMGNGYVDVLIPATLRKTDMVHGTHIRAFLTKTIADIDYQEDIPFAEKLLREREYAPLVQLLNSIKNHAKLS